MSDDRWDPEMRAARQAMDEEAAKFPPVSLDPPFGPSRAINEHLAMMWGQGGPEMPESAEGWVAAHGRRVQCRVHRPSADRSLPVLIWFHGGGWVFQSIDTHDRLVREFAAASGIAVVSVDYSLAPESRFPIAVLECAEVVRKIAETGAAWGLDPHRIVLGGDSAGGNLALATAVKLRDDNGPALRGILTPYPVTSCNFASPSYVEFAEGFGLTRAQMQAYWGLYLRDEADRLNPLAAPLLADLTGLPPTLIQLAELDVLRSDGEALAAKMRISGVDAILEVYPGVLHGFMRLTQPLSKARSAVASAASWLHRVTS